MAQLPIQGTHIGVAGNGVWVWGDDGASRVDSATNAMAQAVPPTCPAGMVAGWRSLQVGAFGVWLSYGTPAPAKRSSHEPPSVLRRLDTDTGAAIADILLPTSVRLQGDTRHVWGVASGLGDETLRLHEIDVGANRLIRTLVLEPVKWNRLAIAGNEAWILSETKDRLGVVKVDLTTGRIMLTIPLAKDRVAYGLAVGRDAVWVSTAPRPWDESGGELGSTGGLIMIDRSTGRLRGTMIPTGTADRLIGVEDDTAWLYNSNGVVVRVRDRPRK